MQGQPSVFHFWRMAGPWGPGVVGLLVAYGIELLGVCRDLRLTPRWAEQAWGFPHVLGLEQGGVRGVKRPRFACCPDVLVDWAWETLTWPLCLVCGEEGSWASTRARNVGLLRVGRALG